jgi:hypothetical protein
MRTVRREALDVVVVGRPQRRVSCGAAAELDVLVVARPDICRGAQNVEFERDRSARSTFCAA